MYKRWRVYSTFLTGLCIGLGYALLISAPLSLGLADAALLIEWRVLVLAFSGILGGVIYTIVTNGEVEMPRFIVTQGGVFKAGLFGDILLGIAGAFILELLLPASASVMEKAEVSGTAITATGIIGGYGGRAIIKFSLERFFKYTGALDGVRAAAITGQSIPATSSIVVAEPSTDNVSSEELADDEHTLSLIAQVDRYIQSGLPAPDWVKLTRQLQAKSASVHHAVLTAFVDLRQDIVGNLDTQLDTPQLQRMIELLNVLIGISPNEHRLYQQLAMVHTELEKPAYDQALVALDKAIALRGPLNISQPWESELYELDRAVVNIQQGHATTQNFTIPEATQAAIVADLLTIAKVYNLDPIVQAADKQQIPTPVVNWIRHNQALLTEQESTQQLMNALRSIIVNSTGIAGNRRRSVGGSVVGSSSVDGSAPTLNPPDGMAAHQDSDGFPKIFSALGRCYDILYLDPFNILGDQSAKPTQVFDFYPQEGDSQRDESDDLLIPKGARYTPGSTGKMEVSSQTQLLYTESDVQNMFASQLGATLTQLLGAVLPFSLSTSYASYKRDRTFKKNVYAFTKAEYTHYTLAIDSPHSTDLHLNETFRQAVIRLPLTANYEYLNFINDFGTHTATQVDFGGLFHHRYCLTQSSYEGIVQSGGNVSVEAKHAFAAKYERKREGNTRKEFSDISEVSDFCGGMKGKDIHDWFGTIKADPAPIHLELMPLYELLESNLFPEDEQIIKKRSLLATATQTYLKRNSQPPAWELWPSAAIGGNGGNQFSDIDLAPIRLKANQERYQNARVKEVRVWIKNWVERVQIVLEGDMPPLPGHGTEDGDLRILKLEPDDYITGVSIRATSPQKILVDRGICIGSIVIQTRKQPPWVVGKPDVRAIALDIPKGYQAIGFHGRCGKRIDKLGVISIPVIK